MATSNEDGFVALNTVDKLCCHDVYKDQFSGKTVDRKISPFEARLATVMFQDFIKKSKDPEDEIRNLKSKQAVLRKIVDTQARNPRFTDKSNKTIISAVGILQAINAKNEQILLETLDKTPLSIDSIYDLYVSEGFQTEKKDKT